MNWTPYLTVRMGLVAFGSGVLVFSVWLLILGGSDQLVYLLPLWLGVAGGIGVVWLALRYDPSPWLRDRERKAEVEREARRVARQDKRRGYGPYYRR